LPLFERKYKFNVITIKRYGDKIKLTQHSILRTKGIECDEPPPEKGSVNELKLDNNISRVKSKLYEYALCNPWDWFITFTLDPAKYDRHDLERYHKELSQWLRDYSKRKCNNQLKFLLVPERHKDDAWHIHGFLYGLPIEHLTPFTLQEHLPDYIRKKLLKGEQVYNWLPYAKKFGYCNIEPIRNNEAASKYILKYITKDLSKCVSEINAHMYYCSRGLQIAETIKQGHLTVNFEEITPIAYENDCVKVAWLPNDDETLQRLTNSIKTERELNESYK